MKTFRGIVKPQYSAPRSIATKRYAEREDLGLTPAEFAILRRLNSPEKIQDYLTAIPSNHEVGGETILPVREVLRQRRAHCIEGAMVAACALWIHGEPPLVMDLTAVEDFDHVITLFRRDRHWGAISKTNGIFLRYRDPIYRNLRELAVSFIHEYANRFDRKTLRSYSRPFDLRKMDPKHWVFGTESLWELDRILSNMKHAPLVTRAQATRLRKRDRFESAAGDLLQYPPPKKKKPSEARAAKKQKQK